MEKAVSRFAWRSMAYTVAEKPHMPVRVAWRRSGIEPGGANEGGGTVLPVAGGRKRKETATPEPEAAAAPKGPKTAG